MDFGPQTRAKLRDLGTAAWELRRGSEQVRLSDNGEWDYDQVMMGRLLRMIDLVYPQQDIVLPFSRGLDTRFLLSVGPFNLDPESTVIIRYITCTGDAVHQDTANWRTNLQADYRPEAYLSNLNFADLLDNVQLRS